MALDMHTAEQTDANSGVDCNCEECGMPGHSLHDCPDVLEMLAEFDEAPTNVQHAVGKSGNKGTGNGSKKGNGKVSKKDEGNEDEGKVMPVATLFDHVRRDVLMDLASRRATLFLDTQPDSEVDEFEERHHCQEEHLRDRIAKDLYRAFEFRKYDDERNRRDPDELVFPVLYKEDKLSTSTGTKGRLVEGFKLKDLCEDYEFYEYVASMAQELGDYAATRSLFNAKRFYRQVARPATVVDLDQKKSFQSAALEVHSACPAVQLYVTNFLAFCDISKADTPDKQDAVKIYVNSIPGGGVPVQTKVLTSLGLDELPKILIDIWYQIKGLAKLDFASFASPDVLRNGGKSKNLPAKAFYVRRCEKERENMDLVAAIVQGEICSFERDGMVIIPDEGVSAMDLVQQANAASEQAGFNHMRWAAKKYKLNDLNMCIAHLKEKHPELPAWTWDKVDSDWWAISKLALNCRSRLARGGWPWLFLAKLLGRMPMPDILGYLVSECCVTSASSKEGLDFWIFEKSAKGGLWIVTPTAIAKGKLTDMLQALLCRLLNVDPLALPDAWVTKGAGGSFWSIIPCQLYDTNLINSLDGPATWNFLQFSDGLVMNIRTGETFPGKPELRIGKSLGIPFPEGYMQRFDQLLANVGLDLGKMFDDLIAYEKGLLMMPYTKVSDSLAEQFQKLLDIPEFLILKIMMDCFMPDLAVGLLRLVKVPSAILFAVPITRFVLDFGRTGNNGKTLCMRVLEVLLGSYGQQPKETFFSKDPPSPGAPSPDLLDLKGRRALFQAEFETSTVVRTAWLKKLPDQSIVWKARLLYSNSEMSFKTRLVPMFSLNENLKFSVVDGGLARRMLAFYFDYTFVEVVTEDFHKKAVSEDVKDEEWLQPYLPAYFYVLHKCYDHYVSKVQIGRIPQRVLDCNDELLGGEVSRDIVDWISANCSVCSAQEADTKKVVCLHLFDYYGVFVFFLRLQ